MSINESTAPCGIGSASHDRPDMNVGGSVPHATKRRRMNPAGGVSAVCLLLMLVLTACRGAPVVAPTPTVALTLPPPTAAATVTAPAAATNSPTATSAPLPTAAGEQFPAGWHTETNAQLSIALPPDWRAIDLTGADAESVFAALQANDARLAALIGGPEALLGAAFWAFGPELTAFIDNLNVRRTPLGSQPITDLQQVLDVLLPEYDKMGLKVTSTDATLRVHGLPAAALTYTMTMNTVDGKGQEVRGRQVIVATDSDLWVLSFSTTPEREGQMAPLFEMSSQSFEPK